MKMIRESITKKIVVWCHGSNKIKLLFEQLIAKYEPPYVVTPKCL